MSRLRRSVVILVFGLSLALALTSALSACGGSSEPTSTPTAEVVGDIKRHSFGDGKTVDLPKEWTVLALDDQLFENLSSGATVAIDDFADSFGGEQGLKRLLQQGTKLLAIDQSSLNQSGGTTNISIASQELNDDLSLENYYRLNVSQIESLGLRILDDFSLEVGDKKTRYLRAALESNGLAINSQQYYWSEGDKVWVVTLTHLAADATEFRTLGEQIVESIR